MSSDLRNVFPVALSKEVQIAVAAFAAVVGVRFTALFLTGVLIEVVMGKVPIIGFVEYLGWAFGLAFVESILSEYVGETAMTEYVVAILGAPLIGVFLIEWGNPDRILGYWVGDPADMYLPLVGFLTVFFTFGIVNQAANNQQTSNKSDHGEKSERQGKGRSNRNLRKKFEQLYRETQQ